MKKKIIVLSLMAFGFLTITPAIANNEPGTTTVISLADWKKSKTGTWAGKKDGKTYWYKLDKEAKLWWSADGKKWAAVENGMWADKDNKWLKINNGKLVWTTDGNNWAEVPEWKWEGSDGKWYKFDDKWTLWVNG